MVVSGPGVRQSRATFPVPGIRQTEIASRVADHNISGLRYTRKSCYRPCGGGRSAFSMDFCGLIVSMGEAEISSRPWVGAIGVLSGLGVSFLLWLLYVHHASADFAGRWMFLPALNALLNGLCAIALCVGFYFIKQHNREAHRASMLLAFAFSSAFLISYIVNHALHGDTIFPGHGPMRTLYLSILASHIILSVVALPMVRTTFFLSLTGRFAMHRRIARFTFPIWLYVSITGVVVFVFLKAYAY